jgi:RNA polymerase sigma-70 factor (ECF subfamily)
VSFQSPKLRLVPRSRDAVEPATATDLEDAQLLAAVRAGDSSAARTLYERTRPIVSRTVRKLLRGADHEYEDLCQQAMIEIVRTIDKYRGECSFSKWVGLLAARVVYKTFRRRQLDRQVQMAAESPALEGISPDQPARRVAERSTIARIRIHLEKLDPDRAWAFLLHDVYGYDMREMTQILGISVTAAQSRLTRGRHDLHERISRDPELAAELEERGGRR